MRTTLGQLRRLVHEASGRFRNKQTGQYSYSSDFDRMCTCGHTLGVHAGEPPHPCFNDDQYVEGATGEPCDCQRFRPKKAA